MSAIKRLQEENEQKRQVAIDIATQVGLLTTCDYHDDEVYDPGENNYDEAYKLANSLITKKDPLVAVFEGNRKELADLIKDITNEFGDECSLCAKWKEED